MTKSVSELSRATAKELGCETGITVNHRMSGFSLIELMIALAILTIVAGVVTRGMLSMTNVQGTINNRTEMHSTVRSATELLQQEIGQAGRITLPPGNQTPTLQTAVAVVPGNLLTQTVTVAPSTTGMFNAEQLVIDSGTNPATGVPNQETVTILPGTLTNNSFQATFTTSHNVGAAIAVLGAFSSGIVPPGGLTVNGTAVAGSGPNQLRLYGDINGDGNIVIVQYDCNPNAAGTGTLTRSVTSWNDPAPGATLTLLNNLGNNPNNTPCFAYQPNPLTPIQINGVNVNFITDVAVTLTVQTPFRDPVTHQFQQETKALLNVSPRNIFDIWERASQGTYGRVQPMPNSVATLLNQIQ
jgi:prepilin-type N-terminal cleavage/methylation domain-containing protein